MKYFKINKSHYKSTGINPDTIWIQYDIYDIETGVIFFRFHENKRNYLIDKQIQCTPEWEPYKELLTHIFETLQEDIIYNYNVVLGTIREIKLNQLLDT